MKQTLLLIVAGGAVLTATIVAVGCARTDALASETTRSSAEEAAAAHESPNARASPRIMTLPEVAPRTRIERATCPLGGGCSIH